MNHLFAVVLVLVWSGSALAQSTSVMIDDLTTTEVQAAIDAGKTTAIYYVGGTHQNGPAVALGKHNLIAAHVSRRVAETLGNALAYPPNPYAPAGDPNERAGHMRFAGTISVSHETLAAVSRDVAVSALAVGFTHVVILGDHSETQSVIREAAATLDAEWRSKGGRVFFIPVYEEGEGRMREILEELGVPRNQMTPIDDASEILAIDPEGRWLRRDQLADEIAAVASAELGRQFIDGKVEVAVASIRELVGR
jgi:creatinine amidohydrolase/Fe(II)-dependent formamide hydrolase-like protein